MAVEAQPKAEQHAAKPAGLPKLLKPYFYVTGYYAMVAGAIAAVLIGSPVLQNYLPIGGAAEFAGSQTFDRNEVFEAVAASHSSALVEGVKLTLSIVMSFVLMLPVTWICMGARRRKDVSQSFIQTILVLPMLITGIVHVVHNSLALAFSLAGIVAGVRFRHTLKDSAETTYLFTAIAVGVSCGINAVEVAAIISIFFNYTVLGLWATEFGAEATGKQMFSREWMAKGEAPKRRESDDDDDD